MTEWLVLLVVLLLFLLLSMLRRRMLDHPGTHLGSGTHLFDGSEDAGAGPAPAPPAGKEPQA